MKTIIMMKMLSSSIMTSHTAMPSVKSPPKTSFDSPTRSGISKVGSAMSNMASPRGSLDMGSRMMMNNGSPSLGANFGSMSPRGSFDMGPRGFVPMMSTTMNASSPMSPRGSIDMGSGWSIRNRTDPWANSSPMMSTLPSAAPTGVEMANMPAGMAVLGVVGGNHNLDLSNEFI
jgi:hypothetical protein